MTRLFLLTVLATAVAAPVQAQAPSRAERCVSIDSSTRWEPVDDHTVLVRSGARALRLATKTCPELADANAQVNPRIYGGSLLCGGNDVELYVAGGGSSIFRRCIVTDTAPVTQAEARALEDRSPRAGPHF